VKLSYITLYYLTWPKQQTAATRTTTEKQLVW